MSYIDGDERYEDFYGLHFAETPRQGSYRLCDLCRVAQALPHTDYCGKCEAEIDREELADTLKDVELYNEGVPLEEIPRIKQEPLAGPTFAELRRLLDKLP